MAWPAKQYTSPGTHINSTQNATQQSNLPIAKITSSPSLPPENTKITADDVKDGKLVVRAMLTGATVPLFDVFLLVIAVLVDAAERGATERLQGYKSPATTAGVEIFFEEPVPARTSPPFFKVQWLMEAMASIPQYMIRKGVFKEALLFVEIDGVRVADGFLGGKGLGLGLTNVSSDAAVS